MCGSSRPSMKKAVPNPVPRVMTASKPLPATTAAPWTSASLATRHGLPIALRQRGGQVEMWPRPLKAHVDLGAGPVLGDEVRRAEHAAPAHHAGEAGRDAVGLGQLLGQPGELLDQALGRHRVGRRDPHPVGHHLAVGVEHVGLEPGAADVDGERVGVLELGGRS